MHSRSLSLICQCSKDNSFFLVFHISVLESENEENGHISAIKNTLYLAFYWPGLYITLKDLNTSEATLIKLRSVLLLCPMYLVSNNWLYVSYYTLYVYWRSENDTQSMMHWYVEGFDIKCNQGISGPQFILTLLFCSSLSPKSQNVFSLNFHHPFKSKTPQEMN